MTHVFIWNVHLTEVSFSVFFEAIDEEENLQISHFQGHAT